MDHSNSLPARRAEAGEGASIPALTPAQQLHFNALYSEHFDFVFRNLRRLGVPSAIVEDALQEVYLVVLRQMDRYQPGTHPKAWLFAIAYRVASTQRRTLSRRRDTAVLDTDGFCSAEAGPAERVEQAEARALLHGFLDSLCDAQRMVFMMVELEQMSAAEVSETLGVNVNTVYARLRTARQHFVRLVRRTRATEATVYAGWSQRQPALP